MPVEIGGGDDPIILTDFEIELKVAMYKNHRPVLRVNPAKCEHAVVKDEKLVIPRVMFTVASVGHYGQVWICADCLLLFLKEN